MRNIYFIIFAFTLVGPLIYRYFRIFILLPIRLHRTQTQTINPDFEYATPEHITPELAEMLRIILPQFRAEGFAAVANLHHGKSVPGVRAVQTLLVNRESGDIAIIIATWSKGSRSTVFAVRSIFDDETSVVTGVNRGIGFFPKNPSESAMTFSWIKEAHTLCEAHRRRLRQLNLADRRRYPPNPGEELIYLTREWERGCARQVKNGYRWADVGAGVLRYTWKGAFLSAWKLTPPIKGWRIALRDRRARREWKLLQMDQWSIPPALAAAPPGPAAPVSFSNQTAHPPDASSGLAYELSLPENEIRQEFAGNSVIVRMGRPTLGRFFARQWYTIFLFASAIVFVAISLHFYWRIMLLTRRRAIPFSVLASVFGIPFLLIGISIVQQVRRLILGAISLRGTVVITASPQGLSFKNTPGSPHTGFIAREDLRGFIVAGGKQGKRKSVRFLFALKESGPNQLLLAGLNGDELEAVRTNIARVIGLEIMVSDVAASVQV